jgi:hypothetical protein
MKVTFLAPEGIRAKDRRYHLDREEMSIPKQITNPRQPSERSKILERQSQKEGARARMKKNSSTTVAIEENNKPQEKRIKEPTKRQHRRMNHQV